MFEYLWVVRVMQINLPDNFSDLTPFGQHCAIVLAWPMRDGKPTPSTEQVRRCLEGRGDVTHAQLLARLPNLTKFQINNAIHKLARTGRLMRVKKAVYRWAT